MGLFSKLTSLIGNSKQPQAVPNPLPPAPPKKILIVEDDKDIRDSYSELLSSEGYTVITAENGQAGLDAVTSQKPNVVMLDLMMPIMDGKTMLHLMRQIPEFKKTPVIVLTNAGDAENIRDTKFFDNANDFLVKANTAPDEILNKIRTFASLS
ncbi:MAG TPA: response regulator transcription factor [Candidatus Saccharimonadales bacterium]|nr:response regulator transcription factor [Candidatus Saccharimonadales bacterium]